MTQANFKFNFSTVILILDKCKSHKLPSRESYHVTRMIKLFHYSINNLDKLFSFFFSFL